MIKYYIVKKDTQPANEQTDDCIVIKLRDIDTLKQFIAETSSRNLAQNDYYVENTKESLEFFKEEYNPRFYVVGGEFIKLLPLSNGIRRTRVYIKKQDNNALLRRTLLKIKEDLNIAGDGLGLTFEIEEGYFDENDDTHIISVKIGENPLTPPGYCVVRFNKRTWSFKLVSIVSMKLKEAYEIITSAFEKRTCSTRVFRKKNNENNPK